MSNLAETIRSLLVPPGYLGIFWLGGASFAFKTGAGRIVYVDPYLSDALEHCYSWRRLPASPIPMAPDDVVADLILTTHAHEDHLDPEAIPALARATEALFVGPSQCVEAMRRWGLAAERVVEMNRGDARTLAGVGVAAVLAHHVSPAGAQTPDAVGYLLDLDGFVVYHTGDTLYHPDLQRVRDRAPDLLLVCINGQYGNMTPQEAAHLTAEVQPRGVIPMHWGLVAENTADPADFVVALAATGSRARPIVLAPGEACLWRGAQGS